MISQLTRRRQGESKYIYVTASAPRTVNLSALARCESFKLLAVVTSFRRGISARPQRINREKLSNEPESEEACRYRNNNGPQ